MQAGAAWLEQRPQLGREVFGRGAREVPRWFAEPGADGGLVDFRAVMRALLDAGYSGWIVVESDQSPHPAASALLAGYLVQRELRPLVEHLQAAPAGR